MIGCFKYKGDIYYLNDNNYKLNNASIETVESEDNSTIFNVGKNDEFTVMLVSYLTYASSFLKSSYSEIFSDIKDPINFNNEFIATKIIPELIKRSKKVGINDESIFNIVSVISDGNKAYFINNTGYSRRMSDFDFFVQESFMRACMDELKMSDFMEKIKVSLYLLNKNLLHLLTPLTLYNVTKKEKCFISEEDLKTSYKNYINGGEI